MTIYNRYLIHKIASYFLVIISVLVALIWFAKSIIFIRFITENGVSISDFISLFVLILPALLIIIIPISLFVAVLTAYSQMLAHNEIVILKNAGLDKLTLAKPAILLASICCMICFLISFFLMPYANKKLRTMRLDVQQNYANLLISPGIFENLNSLTIYVKSRYSDQLSGILIYDSRNPEYSTTVTSKTGNINQDDGLILLYLNKGTVQKFNYQTRKSEILNFDSYVVNLSDNNQQDSVLRWKASERYIGELINPDENSTPRQLAEYYVELQQRITYPFLSLALSLIASAFILSGKFNRHGNLQHNLKALCCAISFVLLMMFGYSIIGKSPQLTILVYLILLFFIAASFWLLRSHKQILK